MNKEVTKLVRQLRSQGLEVVPSGSGHFNVLQDGNKVWGIPKTPSDSRWLANTMSELKKRGIWNPDVKKLRDSGGQSPPPVFSQIATKEEPMQARPEWQENLSFVYQDATDHFKISPPRLGRVLAHGIIPAIANVVSSYSMETNTPIPVSTLRRDADQEEKAQLASTRAAKAFSEQASNPSEVVKDSVQIVIDAWYWFSAQGYVFPDGRTLVINQRGVTAVWPDLPTDDDDVDDVTAETLRLIAEADSMTSFVTSGSSVTTPLLVTSPAYNTTTKNGNGVSMDRAKLAVEVAAAIKDFDRAYTLASKVLEV